MELQIQSGFRVRYRLWADQGLYEQIIEGAVKYKRRCGLSAIWPSYRFYDRKGRLVFYLPEVEVHFIERIFTTALEQQPVSLLSKIKTFLKIK
jgi:hypothetical protein